MNIHLGHVLPLAAFLDLFVFHYVLKFVNKLVLEVLAWQFRQQNLNGPQVVLLDVIQQKFDLLYLIM